MEGPELIPRARALSSIAGGGLLLVAIVHIAGSCALRLSSVAARRGTLALQSLQKGLLVQSPRHPALQVVELLLASRGLREAVAVQQLLPLPKGHRHHAVEPAQPLQLPLPKRRRASRPEELMVIRLQVGIGPLCAELRPGLRLSHTRGRPIIEEDLAGREHLALLSLRPACRG